MTNPVKADWKDIQEKAFTNWCREVLKGSPKAKTLTVNVLSDDLQDGLVLIAMLETLAAPKKVGPYNKNPKIKPQLIENLNAVFKFLAKENVKVVNISAEDIYDKNLKLILGLIWTLIRHYQIRSTGVGISTKVAMMGWVHAQVPDAGIKNFGTSWNNGIALSKLVNRLKPNAIPNVDQLKPANGLENCRVAMEVAQSQLGVPMLISPEDMHNPSVDELSVMTYLSYFTKIGNSVLLMWVQSLVPDRNITNLSSDWIDGINLAALLEAISPGLVPNWKQWDPAQAVENITRGMTLAEQVFGIKTALTPHQLANPNIDELSVSSYLACFMNARPVDTTRTIVAYGPGLKSASVGRGTYFHVDISRAGGKGHIQVLIQNAIVTTGQEPGQPGQIRVNYTPRSGGKSPVEVKWNQQHIMGSPFYVDVLDLETLAIEGLRAGMAIAVECKFSFMVKGVCGSEELTVSMKHATGSELAKIIQRGKGDYEVNYTPRRLGHLEVSVLLGELPLPGSPFDVSVVDPETCQISLVDPVDSATVLIGRPAMFVVASSEMNMRGVTVEVQTPSGSKYLQPLMKEKGLYSCIYSAGEIGTHTVVATCGGVSIKGSPIELNVVSSGKCTFVTAIPRFIPLNDNTVLKISTKYAGDSQVECASNNPSVVGTRLEKDVGGLVNLILTPHHLGEAMITATFAGVPLHQSPFPVGVVDPSQCVFEEEVFSSSTFKYKQTMEFPIRVAGAGHGEMKVMLKSTSTIYGGEVRDNRDGTYRVRITPQEVGKHAVEIYWCGHHIPGSPFSMDVSKAVPLKSFRTDGEGFARCIATRPSGGLLRGPEKGLLPRFSVRMEGEGLYCHQLSASLITTSDEIQVVIQDNGDSSYYVNYVVPKAGHYTLAIMVEGQNIPGSPFAIDASAPPNADLCHALGEMLDPHLFFSLQRPIEFKVDVTTAGAGQLTVRGRDPIGAEEPMYCASEAISTQRLYTIRFAPRMIGTYVVEVFWDGLPIRNSPFEFHVVDPTKVVLSGVPHYDYIGCVGNALEITGDTRAAGVGAPFNVIAVHAEQQEEYFELTEGEGGVFQARFTPRASGVVRIMPHYNNDPLLTQPLSIEVYNPEHYTVNPPEIMGKLKEYVKFPIVGLTKNTRGLTLSAVHPNHNATVKLEPKGEVQVIRFTPKYTGAYQVEVKIAGGHVTNSPFTVQVCNPDTCRVVGHFPPVLLTNVPSTARFNCANAGPGKLVVEPVCTSGPLTLNCDVVQQDKGIWEVTFSSAFVSNNDVTLKWGDYVICGSPLSLAVVDTSNVTYKCPQLRNNSFTYTSEVFEIWMDSAQAGGVRPEVVARGPKDRYNVKIKAGKANNYIASFTPWQVGETSVEILISGQTVAGTPFKMDALKRIDPRLVQVTGTPLKQCIATRPQELSIITSEAGLMDSGRLVVSLNPLSKAKTPLPVEYEVVDNGGGNYTLNFTCPEMISYVLKVTIDEQSIKGSPFTLKCLPPPEADKCKVIGALNQKNLAFALGQPIQWEVDTTDAGIGELNVRIVNDSGDDEMVYIADPVKGAKRVVYSCRFHAKNLGRYSVILTYGGSPLLKSPYTIYMCDPPKCAFLDLPDADRFTPFLNDPFTVTVDCREGGQGPLKGYLHYSNGDIEELEVEEGSGDKQGVFVVTVLPRRLGEIQLHITFNGFPLLTPPWTDEVADPGGFNVVPPSGIWKRHAYVKFNVFGVKPTTRNVAIKAYHPEHDAVVTVDFAEGHGICQFTPKQIGDYTVDAFCAGTAMGGSPFVVPVCDPASCRIIGDIPDLLVVGREMTYIVDGEGAGPGELSASLHVYSGQDPLTISVEKKSEFQYLVRMAPHDVGMTKVTVKWANFNLPDFPMDVKLIDVDRCIISLPQMYSNNFPTQESFEVRIDAREVGRVSPEVHLLGPQGPYQGNLIDHKNGIFTASFIPWQLGKHRLEVLFVGMLVSMCPYEFDVVRPLEVDKMGIDASTIGTIIAGQRVDVTMVAHEVGLLERGCLEFELLPLELDGSLASMDLLEVSMKDNGNGTYSGYFTLPVSGTYTFKCTVEGKQVRGSPCTIFCQRGPEVDKIQMSGLIFSSTEALLFSSIIEIELDVTDAGFGDLLVKAVDYTGATQSVYTKEELRKGRKIRRVRLDITECSTYDMDIFWGGERVQGCPYHFDVVSPEDVIIEGLPLPNNGLVLIGQPISFAVDMSKAGNVVPDVRVSLPGLEDKGQEVESYSRDGRVYFYKMETLELGTLLLSISIGGHKVPGSPFRCQVVDPSMYGIVDFDLGDKAALINQPITFGVRGAFTDKQTMKAVAHGPGATVKIDLSRDQINNYKAVFTPVEAGMYNLYVEYGGENVAGSPLPVPVVDPSRVLILGELPNFLHVGEEDEIIIKCHGAGEGELKMYINERASSSLIYTSLEHRALNTYALVMKARQVGTAKLDIQFGGYTIPQCPFVAELLNESQVVVQSESFKEMKGVVGDAVRIEVLTEGAGKAELMVRAKGPTSKQLVTMERQEDVYTYIGEFISWETGEHSVEVLWGERHVPGSPFTLVVAMSDAEACTAVGEGLKHAVAGEEAYFTVLSNEVGLLERNLLSVTVRGIHKNGQVNIKDMNDGSYQVTYVAPLPGAYVVGVFYRNKTIKSSPYKVTVSPGPDASKVQVYGPALHPNSIHISGVPLEFYVDALRAGTGELSIFIRGPQDYRPKVFQQTDAKGVHGCKFDALISGKYLIFVLWSKVQVPGSPYKLRVYPAPDASKVVARGPGLEDGLLGTDAEFTVETREAGIGSLSIRVHGIKESFKVDANPLPEDPRTLSCSYKPLRAGEYVIFIRWSGKHVPRSPFRVRIFKPKPKHGESVQEDEEVENPLVEEILVARDSNVLPVLQPISVEPLDSTLAEDVAYLGKKRLPKEGKQKKKFIRKSMSKGELKKVSVQSGTAVSSPVGRQMLVQSGTASLQQEQSSLEQSPSLQLQYTVELPPTVEEDGEKEEALQGAVVQVDTSQEKKSKSSWFRRSRKTTKSPSPAQHSDSEEEGPVEHKKQKRGWFKVTKKSRATRPAIPVEEDQMDYQQMDLVEGAGKAVTGTEQQLVDGHTVIMGATEVQERHKVIIQYSGDQPPSLQELVDSGQLPQEVLEADVTFEKVEGEGGLVQSTGSEQRTVTVHREQLASGGFHVSGAGEVSGGQVASGSGQDAVEGGMAIVEGQRGQTVTGGQMVVAGGGIEVVERQRMTVQYSGDSSPDPKQLMAAAQGQAVEEGSVVVQKEAKKRRGWFGGKSKKRNEVIPHTPSLTPQQVDVDAQFDAATEQQQMVGGRTVMMGTTEQVRAAPHSPPLTQQQVEFGAAGAGQVVMATEQQQMVAGQTVMMGTSEVQEKRKVIIQYSGDQPPSLQELVDSGQLPQEALEGEVIFEKVEQGVSGGEVRVEKKRRGWFRRKSKKKDQVVPHSPPPAQQQAAFGLDAEAQLTVAKGQQQMAYNEAVMMERTEVQEKRRVTVQYSGDQPPSLQELVDSGQLPQEALEGEVIFEKVPPSFHTHLA